MIEGNKYKDGAINMSARLLLVALTVFVFLMFPLNASGTITVEDALIEKDTVWSGEVLVRGRVLVQREATLTIEPGTIVKFEAMDRNKDGFGDGEIFVRGKIVARGTPEKKIVFTSASEDPQPLDWTYLILNLTKYENVFENCVIEYAYSGLQVTFARVTVKNCTARHNIEGLRFGRAEGTFDGNDIYSNKYGIRYNPNADANMVVVRNRVHDNKVGIFGAPPERNWLDFMKLYNTPSPVPPTFKDNNIFDNEEYNAVLGSVQKFDVDFTGNWWGSTDARAINDSLWDRADDETLGKVVVEPFLTKPVEGDEEK